MATAKSTTVQAIRVVEELGITLTLTQEEAQVLQFVLHHVGGAKAGPRGHIDAISFALTDAGIVVRRNQFQLEPHTRSIYFADNQTEETR